MLDFILIRQKDHILSLIADGKLDEALLLLDFIKPLWENNTYLYKWNEIKQIMVNYCRQEIIDATHWKVDQKWQTTLAKVHAA